ncbi:hypothetical protein L6472_05380 [Prevotella sp. E13-17]|uniref:hypothetical protein n=1 Tax=Prevotella sp. E13-17 TaxID=2913616 RepID=UPI001EDB9C67|nr:hypothetical protein [Prevotella sp. E13-17]UKK52009.1 hypothetical protein L6472_05380 [Prevotella sp. E13-17]
MDYEKSMTMKKMMLSLVLTLLSLTLYAQTESPHLSFKGVPIDGTLSEYVQKMKQKGFDDMGTEDGIAILTGDFAAYKGCTIGVSTLKQKDLVSKIIVFFPDCDTWAPLSRNYFLLKEMLTEKYGEPANVIEEFQGYSEPKDDASRMTKVQIDQCKYITTFKTPKGEIQLSISHKGVMKCFVVLTYKDGINSDIIRAKAMEDL